MLDFGALRTRLDRHGFDVASSHFTQAVSAFERKEFESCNAQVRSALESLFDEVASLTLGSTRKGGAARKQIEERGLLSDREGAFVKAFMDLAGASGSHAGTSSEDETLCRLLAGLGVAHLALSLCPELIRVQDVLSLSFVSPAGATLPFDSNITTVCPSCKQSQTLVEASVQRLNADTVYRCKNGCQAIVVVGKPESQDWPGRGFRLGDYVIRNPSDLQLKIEGASKSVQFPASVAALMLKRPDDAA